MVRPCPRSVMPALRGGCLRMTVNGGRCLGEAVLMQTGARLRTLFATILLFCTPTRPEALWEEFREGLCDDLPRRLPALATPPASCSWVTKSDSRGCIRLRPVSSRSFVKRCTPLSRRFSTHALAKEQLGRPSHQSFNCRTTCVRQREGTGGA